MSKNASILRRRGCAAVFTMILALCPIATGQEPGEPLSVPDEGAPDEGIVRVSPQGTVEMHVADLPLATALQLLSMQSRRNIVASKNVTGVVTANLYNVSFYEALDAILLANQCGYREVGSFVYVYTDQELVEMTARETPMESRIFRLSYITAEHASEMITPILSEGAVVTVSPAAEMGLESSEEEAGGNTLATEDVMLIIDYPYVLERIAQVLAELDTRPRQVLVEATILRAQLTEDNQLGIDFNLVGGVSFAGLNAVSNAVQDLTLGNLARGRLNDFNVHASTDFAGDVDPGGITIGIIEDHVAVFIRALESITDVTVLANPKILALNKQKGQMIVGRRDGYLTTTVTETTTTQTVEYLETGTRLIFRPYIGNDGYVRMEIHPEDSTGGLTAANLPSEQTTEITSNILVKDGQTILIGGLFREVSRDTRSQVPIIGNVPILGKAFQSRADRTEREEVIILLTVNIIKDDRRFARAGMDMYEDIERIRVGLRSGMQEHGRELLAQAHYRWAMEHYAAGHLSRALWDTRLALVLNPRFLSARKLKEQLLDRRDWADDNSAIRNFIQRLIMEEKGSVHPVFERPGPPFRQEESVIGPSGFEDITEEDQIPELQFAPEGSLTKAELAAALAEGEVE